LKLKGSGPEYYIFSGHIAYYTSNDEIAAPPNRRGGIKKNT